MTLTEKRQLADEYRSRVNRAVDYIEANIDKSFTLEELAMVSNFSKFHFHRIFLAMTGETPFQFIQRLRLEKAASMMVTSPEQRITDIAFKCGFSDISVFSRNFRSHFKKSATEFRSQELKKSNLSQRESKGEQASEMPEVYFCHQSKTLKWRTNMRLNKSVEVIELQKMTVAYIRNTGPFKGDQKLFSTLWGKLCTWAGARGLMQQSDIKFITVYHDDPNVTVEDKLRISVCLTVPADTKVDGEFGKMEIDAGRYVVARFEVSQDEFMEAWQWVYGQWFPTSGFQPGDGPCFEVYPKEPENGIFLVDIYVPVKPI